MTTPHWRAALAQAQARLQQQDGAAALALLLPLTDEGCTALEVLSLTAVLLERQHRLAEAQALWRLAQRHHPENLEVLNGLGRVLAQLAQPAEALLQFEAVLARQPQQPEALFNRGNALRLLGRREEAIEAYRAVLPLHADYARLALLEIARQQQALLDFDGARISYLQLGLVAPGKLETIGYRLSLEAYRWPPEPLAATALARELGSHWAAQQPPMVLPPSPPRQPDTPLRIGLVSGDLRAHPVGFFLGSLLGASAARTVEWVAYSNLAPALHPPTPVAQRLRAAMSQWHDVADWSDERLAQQVRADGIDVLVDLSGYTAHHRLAAFAARPAPLQLSWLGYHGTTGLPFIDGVIADWHCVPAGEEAFFTEPLLRLPHTRFCYTPPVEAPAVSASPALRRGAITFGCFQQMDKIAPQVLQAWARIAAAVPEARWHILLGDAESSTADWQRFRARCAAAGFAPQHLQVAGRLEYADYLAAYGAVDVMLDTFPYTGGTTTADALWMGVPTLTLSTPGMLGRQGEQILRAADLPQWITRSVDDYVALAIATARSAAEAPWARTRPALRERLRSSAFLDREQFGRDWMQAVQRFWRQRLPVEQADDASASPRLMFYVPALDTAHGGAKVIYEQVAALNQLGFRAFTYTPLGSRAGAFWSVPRFELDAWQPTPGDVVVAPEVMSADWLLAVRSTGCALWLFVQNWGYVAHSFAAVPSEGAAPFDGVLVISNSTEAIVRRCLPQLPCWRVPHALAASTASSAPPRPAIAYMPRKLPEMARFLRSTWPLANPDLAEIEWIEIDGLPHAEVMAKLQAARYFVSLQSVEGLGLPALEAMAAGCLVVGFTGVGGNEYARPDNGLWMADNDGLALLDVLSQAVREERASPGAFDALRDAGRRTAARYSPAARDAALRLAFEDVVRRWRGRASAMTASSAATD